jgi:hypothetical protein
LGFKSGHYQSDRAVAPNRLHTKSAADGSKRLIKLFQNCRIFQS